MAKSVYIHIPFCKSKCNYCSFISATNIDDAKKYTNALINEIKQSYKGELLNTLYFGGGTPSVIDLNLIKNVLDNFNYNENTEITFEINPDDANFEYLKSLKNTGINRLSFGAQSFNDDILKTIGRRHNSEQTINVVKNARKAGFNNISIDLMYGLPSQTTELLNKDLEIISSLDITHVSTYGLKIENNSYFGKNPPNNLPNNDIQADMYLLINDFLSKIGFERYEISNFSKKGYESKHNLNYWNNDTYYGLGLSAHGYLNGTRYSNTEIFDEYINSSKRKTEHFVTPTEKIEEEIFLGFRKAVGINETDFYNKFNIKFSEKYKKVLQKYMPEYIEQTANGYKLTISGVLLSNIILSDFLD